jgi:hypothetical protein
MRNEDNYLTTTATTTTTWSINGLGLTSFQIAWAIHSNIFLLPGGTNISMMTPIPSSPSIQQRQKQQKEEVEQKAEEKEESKEVQVDDPDPDDDNNNNNNEKESSLLFHILSFPEF